MECKEIELAKMEQLTVIILDGGADSGDNADSAQLARARSSVAWADQVIVAKFPQPITDFAQARNKALAQGRYPWVFFLDSDEVLEASEEQVREALYFLECGGYVAARVLRSDVFLGRMLRWGEVRHHRVTRFLLKGKAKYRRPVHEVVEAQGRVCDLNIRLRHFSHESIFGFIEKIRCYAMLEAEYRVNGDKIGEGELNRGEANGGKVDERKSSNEKQNKKKTIFVLSIFLYPLAKFVLNFGLRCGFLDGWRGLVYALMMSVHSLSMRLMWYEKTH